MSPMIETVSGDMQEKYNTYKTMMKRYNLAVKYEFYFEAMLIIYAMLEDRFRSFIYHAGFLDDRDSKGLGHKRLKLFVRFLMEEYCDIPHDSRLKLDNISAKMDVVKALIMWAQNDREPVGKFQTELKKQLKTPYHKDKMQYPRAIREYILSDAGLTDEERDIFLMRSKGLTVLEISFEMETLYKSKYQQYGVEKVERKIRAIKNKIASIL